MLTAIPILVSFLVAAIYPLCFWISHRDPLKKNFHRFHLGMPVFVLGVLTVSQMTGPAPFDIKAHLIVWFIVLAGLCAYFWNREYPNPWLITAPCLIGLAGFPEIQTELADPGLHLTFAWGLGAAIFCASLYAMNLGHWYLNVHGLPLDHLTRAVNVLWVLTAIRLIWDIAVMSSAKVVHQGTVIPLHQFVLTMDGFLLILAVFFGTLFPLATVFFVHGTLKAKSTQSATGILYVILTAVLIGEMAYKYYLLKFSIAL
ncbi:MAG: hypothetical protein Q8Q08_09275 [Candidatus Omnitrophota bacterium]|nr:hypothetical protein [Candidatus Omnitrophota bacterium]MDZ4241815.1 hypothetical protein [Candidatus Omnitrophota bacterium]